MAKPASSFSRSSLKYKVQPRFLILCEDTKSSLSYIQEAARYFRAYADVEVINCGRTDPQGIVDEAVRRKSKYEKVFCVIDRDGHPLFHQALDKAKPHETVEMIASYPCYEYWLLLHFKESRKSYKSIGQESACDQLLKDLRKHPIIAGYEKGKSNGLFDSLIDHLGGARIRAVRTLADGHKSGDFDPSTQIHLLIDALEDLGKLKIK